MAEKLCPIRYDAGIVHVTIPPLQGPPVPMSLQFQFEGPLKKVKIASTNTGDFPGVLSKSFKASSYAPLVSAIAQELMALSA
jgi:hypothetical protein